ncbi:MAG TPA: UDP-2,3-diacylglucosamine diphosphatase, partial [Burkholderiales bacterium]|nr:UDP-2,3-diacylglucosamine diphosphatase [Burkholderiales bacterium]
MHHTLFISDLHLTAERPHINQQFFDFLQQVAPAAQALYVLGDLFEYWVGDDDTEDALNTEVAAALSQLSRRGVPVYFMHGNRDVLIGEAFAARSGASLIADPTVIDLHGTRTLLMHGDTL